ncbi:MAG: Anthranilate phosphoribosyltransferase [Candidatus Hinthialibacteria bacterium OLB16]|nr:MAG: Anthranilate phosphoribosyltransferase [Candidatus Hinthialibacteria bacterium OLB16]
MSLKDWLRPLLAEQALPPPEMLVAIERLLRLNGHLAANSTVQAMRLLMDGRAPERDRLSFLRAFSLETANGEMLAAAAGVLRMLAPKIPFHAELIFDSCGTGGDRTGLLNISTLAALVLAAAGIPVAKHGNRAITSSCGSADLLESLGVPIEVKPPEAADMLRQAGIVFLFAPFYHRATRNVQPLRLILNKEGHATLFNLLGPLSNPMEPTHQVVGVFNPRFMRPMADALNKLGCRKAWVVCGENGQGGWIDEISPCGKTHIIEVLPGQLREFTLDLETAGFARVPFEDLKGGDVVLNRAIAERVLSGETGPGMEVVSLNAGVGLYVCGKVDSVQDGIQQARQILIDKGAWRVLEKWRSFKPAVEAS